MMQKTPAKKLLHPRTETIIAGSLMLSALLGPLLWSWIADHLLIEHEARVALAGTLLDAESARLRNVTRHGTASICGEVNARNAFGAYTGFMQFYADANAAFVDQPDDAGQFAARMCGVPIEPFPDPSD